MEINDIIGHEVSVVDYQATFILVIYNESTLKISFHHKQEFLIKKGTKGILQVLSEHPLLIDYNNSWATMYINSKPANPKSLENDIRLAIERAIQNNRSWLNYATDGMNFRIENFRRNLQEGNGMLLKAPIPICRSVEKICEENNVQTITFESHVSRTPKKLLLIGDSYVVAEEFRLTS